jgi:uncharacterized SAM-binding protein YcdF (DUF218 family)
VKRRVLLFFGGVLLILLVAAPLTWSGWGPWIAQFLIVNELPVRSDLIVIPSGSDDGGRIRHGVALYRQGFAPKILLSGSSYLYRETGIDLMKAYALSLGVPEKDIWSDHDSGSTVENAIYARDIAVKNRVRSVLIATSPTHSRRTRTVFRDVFPKEIRMTVSCSPSAFDVRTWWKTFWMAREVSYEYFVLLWYGLFNR